ncbi:alpha/beta fold hydrolase [Maliponia aquimaris]|uniref:Putative non-heme bromoperoxidase BpoC n=1 Tax=Maliponia aquimaris TaxID=1673631 RepID=A0A238KVS3_9RHOB|nr:alpha/beta fold hydrolase [Maliponia aquimaris]SMX46282.1 Putative non-heme bromoperoxidase BpoC [Maliponia aquimaris]
MTPLVLLPGMMCDARLWGPQMASLGRRAVIHAPITEHDTMQALAAAVLAAAPPRFALAGLSMGGIVAMEILRQAADRVERLALLDTNPRAERPEVRAARDPQIAAVTAGRLRAVMRDELKPNYLVESPEKPAILDLCLDMALGLGPEVFVRQSRALASRPDQTETLAAYRGPTLVLMGAEDKLCPRDRHDQMHALIPGSQLVIVANAGHLPTLEQPQRTTAALLRWLEDT